MPPGHATLCGGTLTCGGGLRRGEPGGRGEPFGLLQDRSFSSLAACRGTAEGINVHAVMHAAVHRTGMQLKKA